MFSSFFETASSYFDQRFILTFWLPSLLFWMALLTLLILWAGGTNTLAWWTQQPLGIHALLIILALTWITLFAQLLSAQIGSLMRFYEGYWDDLPVFRALAKRRKLYYEEKLKELSRQGEQGYKTIYYYFPPVSRVGQVMPTRLGNMLKSSELYPELRYKMDAVLIWPRLYSVLPDRLERNIGSAKAELDMMLVISVLGVAFAVFSGLISMILLPIYFTPLCIWSGFLLSWVGYKGALTSAIPYTQLIRVAFDLHRTTLLKTIGLADPTSYQQERTRWLAIGTLWYRATPNDEQSLGYPAPSSGTDEKKMQ
jgi:hypothetical protein